MAGGLARHGRLASKRAHPPSLPALKAYFIRRLLLIPLTLVGITLLVFTIQRKAPGGPMEQELTQLLGGEGGARRARASEGASLSVAQVMEIEEKYQRDRSLIRGYSDWLGLTQKDLAKAGAEFPKGENEVVISMPGTVYSVKVIKTEDGAVTKQLLDAEGADLDSDEIIAPWEVRLRSPEDQAASWKNWMKGVAVPENLTWRAILYRPGRDGLLQGSLGASEKYQDPVGQMIVDRMPVSIFFGGISMVLIYAICLPLGVVKAIKHRSWLDNFSSVMVFAGYAIPGYALGSLLVVYLGAKLGWFPLGGFPGDQFEQLGPAGKLKDVFEHGFMPLVCYVIGSFAFMTLMMKNNLMEHLASDYVRTATAKGAPFRSAVFKHAFRNSIIPIATTFGSNITLLVAGSILIERVFDINGFGLLQFNALLERDEPLIMGVLFVSATLMLIGNVLSDLCVALVDPRVSYK